MKIRYFPSVETYELALTIEGESCPIRVGVLELLEVFPEVPVELANRAALEPGVWQSETAVLR